MVKSSLKLGIILLLICAISTGLLAYVNMLTAPVIAENTKKQQDEAQREVLASAVKFDDLGDSVFVGMDLSGNPVGYAVSVAPSGYGGAISMIVGVNTDLTISGVKILSMSETPGLGAKANDEKFLSQFKGKDSEMELKKDINAITGATITSTAVTKGVKEAISLVESKGGKK